MKVVPQIVTFIVLVALAGVAYYYYRPFQDLVNDIVHVSGLTEPVQHERPSQPEPVIMPSPVSKPEVTTYAVEDAGKTETKVPQKIEASRPLEVAPRPVEVAPRPVEVAPGPGSIVPNIEKEKSGIVTPVIPSDSKPADVPVAGAANEVPVEPDLPAASPAVPVQTESRPGIQQPASQQRPDVIDQGDAITAPDQPDNKTPEQRALAGLSEARTAWQQGDYDGAVNRYIELMNDYPNHPDFAGELGNIYYARGQRRLAVDAYSEAFSRLMRMNDYDRAWGLLSIIRRMDNQRARQLEAYFAR